VMTSSSASEAIAGGSSSGTHGSGLVHQVVIVAAVASR
jgi:hypothetical protein